MVYTVRLGMAACLLLVLAGCVSRGESAGSATPNRAAIDAAVRHEAGRPGNVVRRGDGCRAWPVTVLLTMSAENVDRDRETAYNHGCWISLVRDDKGNWKARDFRDVDSLQ